MSAIKKKITLGRIAEMVNGVVKGDPSIEVSSILPPEKAVEGSISPLWEKKFIPFVRAGSILFTRRGWTPENCSGVEVDTPRAALIVLLHFFDNTPARKSGISSTAVISEDAHLGANVTVGGGAVIRGGVTIGDNTIIMENVIVDEGSEIGADCFIEPGAVIYHHTKIGNRCVIHANAIIGCEGFGFIPDPRGGMIKIPQIGITHLADDVEIGACSAVDRATFGETYIGPCTKIDSHVKVGHNCTIGGYSIMVAQSGIAGSTTLGKGVIMAAQSGAANHVTIGDGCTIAGRAGVANDVPAGAIFSGFPAQEHKRDLRQQAAAKQLPEIVRKVRELNRRLKALEENNNENSQK